MTKKLLNEGGSGGHMFHPFNLPSVNTGEDLIEFFYKAAEFVSKRPENLIPSDSTSLKVDGANTSFKLVRGPSGLEFAFDRGTMIPLDIEGITLDKLTQRWPEEHGMVTMGRVMLGALNRALPKIKNELIQLGLMDKKGNPNPTIFINSEFCWKETNKVKYKEDFVAFHGVNQYYEKEYRGITRPGAVRPLVRDEKSGQMKPTKVAATEVIYDETVMESFKEKVKPFFKKATSLDAPEGFNVYTVIPVSIKEGADIAASIEQKLNEDLSIQIRARQLNEWESDENTGIATMPLVRWLSDSRTINPRMHFVKTKEGEKKGALSKEIYGRVLSGEPVEDIVADPESWDVAMAINGALFYYAIENVGATILESLTSPIGDMIEYDETGQITNEQEGIVLRNEELFGVKMVKITGNFISAGGSGKFADKRSPVEKEETPEQGDIEPGDPNPEDSLDLNQEVKKIALVPGAFKPAHRGHLNMVNRLAAISQIDEVLVIISRPLQNNRKMANGQAISAEQAHLIWEQYINTSPYKQKIKVMVSPTASPVQVTYDYVMQDPEPGNPLIASANQHVYLGCGDKEDDSSRFDDIVRKARKDLKINIVTCPVDPERGGVKHSEEYLNILRTVPEIGNNIPSVKKGKDFTDFHASDMRYLAVLAEKNLAAFRMFSDFVAPDSELAVLGILGLNAVDQGNEQEPDTEENNTQDISEYINRAIEKVFYESSFQDRVAKPRMRRAMKALLDGGRKDLVKYGAPWNRPRPGSSNAFLAKEGINLRIEKDACSVAAPYPEEENIEEISTMGGGNVQVAAVKVNNLEERE